MNDKNRDPDGRIIYSVSEITRQIKLTLEAGYDSLWIEGEISNLVKSAQGHCYFTIKDDKAVLSGVIFRGNRSRITAPLENGTRALFYGKITVYEPRGNYQLLISKAEQVGQGSLHVQLEQLKKKLHAEGLFDSTRKKMIPSFPRRVGVVTSPTGAALRDVLRVSRTRFKGVDLLIYPTLVQGDAAAANIVRAIEQAQRDNLVDVLIITRGGGSIEDLWPFNEEVVARAVAACPLPTVSGVGHEIDYTLCDMAADLRTPTPSAAAELVFPEQRVLKETLESMQLRLDRQIRYRMEQARQQLQHYSPQQLQHRLNRYLERGRLQLDEMTRRMESGIRSLLRGKHRLLEQQQLRLTALDPRAPLRKGFALVRNSDGELIREPQKTAAGERWELEFAETKTVVTVAEHFAVPDKTDQGVNND